MPESGWRAQSRLAALIVLLAGLIWLALALHRFEREMKRLPNAFEVVISAPMFENLAHVGRATDSRTLELHALYFRSMLAQIIVLSACGDYWAKTGTIPGTRAEFTKAGVGPALLVDPWAREYRVRLLRGGILIVQSTGPSGQDRLPPEILARPQKILGAGPKLFGDNLVVGMQLAGREAKPARES